MLTLILLGIYCFIAGHMYNSFKDGHGYSIPISLLIGIAWLPAIILSIPLILFEEFQKKGLKLSDNRVWIIPFGEMYKESVRQAEEKITKPSGEVRVPMFENLGWGMFRKRKVYGWPSDNMDEALR